MPLRAVLPPTAFRLTKVIEQNEKDGFDVFRVRDVGLERETSSNAHRSL
jgi:hypothetical protein